MNAPLMPYVYKSDPYPFQHDCLERSWDKEIFAVLFEQGAGKSKVIVDTAARLYAAGRIDALVVIAPNGVHRKWIEEDFPFSWPEWCGTYRWSIWQSGSKKSLRACEELLSPGPYLRVLCINVESLSHKEPLAWLKKFLQSTEALVAVDESSRIKNPSTLRTANITKLRNLMKYRRILTGTPVSNSPFDYYAQFNFLDPNIFGCSFYAFKAEYAELVDKESRMMEALMRKNNLKRAPAIVAKDAEGKPLYKNLDKLKRIIAPYSMRVTKEEAMPWLPPKVYQKRYFKMAAAQRKLYDTLKKDMRVEMADASVTVMQKMVLLLRLQQVACGYVPNDEGKMIRFFDKAADNPRIQELLEELEDTDDSVIIWCRFQEDVKQVMEVLGDAAVTLYGPDSHEQRETNKRLFKEGYKKYLVGTPQVGGIGLNLTVSAKQIFYDNSFSYEDRKQAEDRIHRGGQQKDSCLYVDLLAEDSVDEATVAALLRKEDVATYMTSLNFMV